jgi:hypothetical protein
MSDLVIGHRGPLTLRFGLLQRQDLFGPVDYSAAVSLSLSLTVMGPAGAIVLAPWQFHHILPASCRATYFLAGTEFASRYAYTGLGVLAIDGIQFDTRTIRFLPRER